MIERLGAELRELLAPELRKRFLRKLQLKYHPDKNPDREVRPIFLWVQGRWDAEFGDGTAPQPAPSSRPQAHAAKVILWCDGYHLASGQERAGGAGSVRVKFGPSAGDGKGRRWLLVKSEVGIDEAFASLTRHFAAVHTFDASGTTCSLVYRPGRQTRARLPAGHTLWAIDIKEAGKGKDQHVEELWEQIRLAAFRSNISEKHNETASSMPSPLEAVAMYHQAGYTRDDWSNVRGLAKRSKVDKNSTRLQRAILCYGEDLEQLVKAVSEARSVAKPLEGKHFLRDFLAEEVLELTGVHLKMVGEQWVVERIKLKELLWKKHDRHGVYKMYKQKTLIFNGKSNMGKSELCMALAREFALRGGKELYGWGTINTYGAVQKAGEMQRLGCYVFDDFDLWTRGHTHLLTMEEVKQLLYVKQSGTVACFYADAVFPAEVPRLWSINYESSEDKAAWFQRIGHDSMCEGLANLALEDASFFNATKASQNNIATARRAIIFNIDRKLYVPEMDCDASSSSGDEARGTAAP